MKPCVMFLGLDTDSPCLTLYSWAGPQEHTFCLGWRKKGPREHFRLNGGNVEAQEGCWEMLHITWPMVEMGLILLERAELDF